jgi:hypothetical protein
MDSLEAKKTKSKISCLGTFKVDQIFLDLAESTRNSDLLKFSGYLLWFQGNMFLHIYIFNCV